MGDSGKGNCEFWIMNWAQAASLRQRGALGIYYKNCTPEQLRELIYYRNSLKYGDRLGPTYDFLRKSGKTNLEIIESASRTAGEDLEKLFKTISKDLPASGKISLSTMGFI